MNNKDVAKKLAEATGFGEDQCEKLINVFEKQSEIVLEDKIKGKKWSKEEIAESIAKSAEISPEECEIFMKALDGVLDKGLSEKLGFFG